MSRSLLYEALVKHSQNKVKFTERVLIREFTLYLMILMREKNYVGRTMRECWRISRRKYTGLT